MDIQRGTAGCNHNNQADWQDWPPDQTDRELLLAGLRCAALRARLDANEIDTVGIALRGDMISPETAVAWLSDIGLLTQVEDAAHG